MRLIDAETLKDKCDEYDWETIDNAPTVDAIPIDWLVTKAKEMVLSQGKKFYSLLDLPIVYDLIEEWKKENELR